MAVDVVGVPERPARRRTLATPARKTSADALPAALDLARAGQHQQAIDVLSAALTRKRSSDETAFDLRELRAESLVALGEVERALADAVAMCAIGERSGRSELHARALIALANVQAFSGGLADAGETAERAVRIARKSRTKRLVGLALSSLGSIQSKRGQFQAALKSATAALGHFTAADDTKERGRALWVAACAHDGLGHREKTDRAADEALLLARAAGDRWGEASALNIRWRQSMDLGLRLRGLHQALAGYVAAGHVSGQAAIYNNMSLAYRALGLYRRSDRMIEKSNAIRRRLHDFNSLANGLITLAGNATITGDLGSARRYR